MNMFAKEAIHLKEIADKNNVRLYIVEHEKTHAVIVGGVECFSFYKALSIIHDEFKADLYAQ